MHCKYYSEIGEEVPSVTTVLKVLNKPALNFWANSLGFRGKSYKKELERTARVGTLVHAYIEENMKNKVFRDLKKAFELDYQSREEALMSYSAFKNWYKENKSKMNIIHSEHKLICEEYGYGGTIDLITELDGHNYIIDFKTSSKVHSTMFLQLAAYAYMAKENGIEIDRVGILQLGKKDGLYTFTTMSVKKVMEYFDIFLLLLNIYKGWSVINKRDWNITNVFE